MKTSLLKILFLLVLPAIAFGAAGDIRITQFNSAGTAPSDRMIPSDGGQQITTLATLRSGLGLGAEDSPGFTGLTLSGATASTLVYFNASKALATVTLGSSLSLSSGILDAIQDIRTSASPTFAGLTVSGTTANALVYANGSKALASVALQSNLSLSTGTLSLATALTSVNSVTAAASTDLILNGGASGGAGTSLTLGNGATGYATFNRRITLGTTQPTFPFLIYETGNVKLGIRYDGGLSSLDLFANNSGYTRFGTVSAGDGTTFNEFARFFPNSGNLLVGRTTDISGSGGVGINGQLVLGSSITTGAPTTGTAAPWKTGVAVTTTALVPSTTIYLQVDISGTLYKVATVN